jgi:hypothetical protein
MLQDTKYIDDLNIKMTFLKDVRMMKVHYEMRENHRHLNLVVFDVSCPRLEDEQVYLIVPFVVQ